MNTAALARRALRCVLALATPAVVRAASPVPSTRAGHPIADSTRADSTRADSVRAAGDRWNDGTAALLLVRVGRYANGSVLARRVDDTLWIPVRPFFRVVGIRLARRGATLHGVRHPAEVRLRFDPTAGVVDVGPQRLSAGPGALRLADGELYASPRLLETVLGIRLQYDADDATLVVADAEGLPVARSATRAALRTVAAEQLADRLTPGVRPTVDAAGAGVLVDYSVTRWEDAHLGSDADLRVHAETVATVGVATPLLGGIVTARSPIGQAAPAGAGRDVAWTWDRLAGRWLRWARIGDGESGGPRAFGVRGIAFSNTPTLEPTTTNVTLRGVVPAGWAVEAYRAGGFVTADTGVGAGTGDADDAAGVEANRRTQETARAYALTIPVSAGQTMVDLVAVGPDGQMRTMPRLVQRRPLGLAAHAFEYRAAAGACRAADLPTGVTRDACRGRANVDLRYGLSDRWAVRAGVDGLWVRGDVPTATTGVRPYASFAAMPTDALSLDADLAPGRTDRAAVRFQPSPAVLVSASHTVTRDVWLPTNTAVFSDLWNNPMFGLWNPVVTWQRTTIAQSGADVVIAPRAFGGLSLQLHEGRTAWQGAVWEDTRVEVGVPVPGADLRPYVRREVGQAGGARMLVGTSATLLPAGVMGRHLGGTWLVATGEATRAGTLARAELTLAHTLGVAHRLDVGTQWDRLAGGYRGTIAITSQLPAFRTTTQTRLAGGQNGALTVHTVNGAALWDPGTRRLAFSADPALDRAGVAGHVFLDLNGNGRRDPGEPGIPEARLVLASRTAVTDRGGAFSVLGLQPGAALVAALDSSSLTSPWWVPGVAELRVRAVPGRVARMDYPVVLGAIVNGRVTPAAGDRDARLPAGLRVVLRTADGAWQLRGDVFSDGTFSVAGVPPGRFIATVEGAGPAGSRGDEIAADPVAVVVPPPAVPAGPASLSAPGGSVDDVRLTLRPRAGDGAARAQALGTSDGGPVQMLVEVARAGRSAGGAGDGTAAWPVQAVGAQTPTPVGERVADDRHALHALYALHAPRAAGRPAQRAAGPTGEVFAGDDVAQNSGQRERVQVGGRGRAQAGVAPRGPLRPLLEAGAIFTALLLVVVLRRRRARDEDRE